VITFVEKLALFVLLAVAGLRPLITETYRTAGDSPLSLEIAREPLALTTLLLDAALLVASACLVIPRIRRKAYRASGLELGAVLFVIASAISCVAAAEKRPAINASIDWVATLAMTLALVQVLEAETLRRVVLALVVAGGAVNLALAIEQRVAGFAETEQMYFEQREELWSRQGVPLDSAQVKLFERRLAAREVTGQFAHSNIAAGYFALCGFAAIAAAAGACETKRRLAAIAAAAGLLGICWWTGSKAALGAIAAGLVFLGISQLLGPRIEHRPRRAWLGGWVLVFAGIVAIVVIGVVGDGLPGSSLDFRWQYWTASARMALDHGLTGVGAENFGDYYLAYKDLASPEEVKNPHNFLVHFASEYGVVGLAAVLAMLLGASWRIACTARDPLHAARSVPASNTVWRWGFALAMGIFLTRIVLLPSLNYHLVVWATAFGLLSWAAGYALTAWALGGEPARRPMWAAAALCAGLAAFLLQDTVNFALFVPPSRTTFFVLVGLVLAGPTVPRANHVEAASTSPWPGRAALACVVAGLLAVLANLPLAGPAEIQLRAARAKEGSPLIETLDAGFLRRLALRSDPLDATPAYESARYLLALALAEAPQPSPKLLDMALEDLRVAQQRAPRRLVFYRMESQIHALRARLRGDADEWRAAADAMRRAIELYPTRPESYAERAEYLFAQGTCPAAAEALENWQKALDLDDAKPAWEQFHRFTPAQREAIGERIATAQAWLAAECH
jgi:hypothetical protein